jgi:CRP-like cAMP-binding protein
MDSRPLSLSSHNIVQQAVLGMSEGAIESIKKLRASLVLQKAMKRFLYKKQCKMGRMLFLILPRRDDMWKGFSSDDLFTCGETFYILKLNDKEILMERGEEATFLAVILDGELEAKVKVGDDEQAETKQFTLRAGSVMGEVAYFQKGLRTATVQSIRTSLVGILSYKFLEGGMLEKHPHICAKLCMLLAKRAFLLSNINKSVTDTYHKVQMKRSEQEVELKIKQEQALKEAMNVYTARKSSLKQRPKMALSSTPRRSDLVNQMPDKKDNNNFLEAKTFAERKEVRLCNIYSIY